jgi:hypothetical protein
MDRKEYANEMLGLTFTLPEQLTVREQLTFRERLFLSADDTDMYSRYWDAALPLVEDWQCEIVPDPQAVDLDAETDRRVADIVNWFANTVAGHMNEMDDVPKNS